MFETLLFDMDQATISIYIDEINMHHKIRIRDDYRVDSVLFFEEALTVVVLLKNSKKNKPNQLEEKRLRFKQVKHISEVDELFSSEDVIKLRIFDKIKVLVETTTEFPLDINCKLMIT